MIVKKFEEPFEIHQLKAIIPRISPLHEKKSILQADLQRRNAGFQGEKSLEYYLHFLPKEEYYIFHNIRLFNGKYYFQIDVLILTKKILLILEAKNIAGSLFFDTTYKQFIRSKDGKDTAFHDPLTQIKRLESQVKEWIQPFCSIPVVGLVVSCNPSAVIQSNSKTTVPIIPSSYLPHQITSIHQTIQKESLDDQQLQHLVKQVKKKHSPLNPSILSTYKLEKVDIKKGVICPNCGNLPLQRIHSTWYCPSCNTKSKYAHIQALIDYYYIFGNKLTNEQARAFLRVDSKETIGRLMKALNCKRYGNSHRSYYTLSLPTLKKGGK